MFEKITFELFQDADADAVADLLNRNRFCIGKYKRVVAEDYLYLKTGRGMLFSVLAKKGSKVIGMLAAYPDTSQIVCKPHQVFVGSMVLDMLYRSSPSVLIGLLDRATEELAKRGVREILSGVYADNLLSLYVLSKYGFVLLSESADPWGTLILHNFFPAASRFLGVEDTGLLASDYFNNLLVVNKKEVRKAKTLIGGRYIECLFSLHKNNILLLIDTMEANVSGFDYENHFKLYPDPDSSKNRYLLSSRKKSGNLDVIVEDFANNSDKPAKTMSISLPPGGERAFECAGSKGKITVTYCNEKYNIHYQGIEQLSNNDSLVTELKHKSYPVSFDQSTGFLAVKTPPGEKNLLQIMWPCASMPYIEGVIAPRQKLLNITTDKNTITASENTDDFVMTRHITLHDDKISIVTRLKRIAPCFEANPMSGLYVESEANNCTLKSSDNQMVLEKPVVSQGFEDYRFWTPQPDEEILSSVKSFTLDFGSSVLDVFVKKNSRSIVHYPLFSFFPEVDAGNDADDEEIERLEIYFE